MADKIVPESKIPVVYLYDGTFDGFLTVVFDIYTSKCKPVRIVKYTRRQPGLFDTEISVATDAAKSERVWRRILELAGIHVSQMFCLAFASDLPDIEMPMFRWAEKLFADPAGNFPRNLLDDSAHTLYHVARKVKGEIHRFYGFTRFRETSEGLYFAAIEPDHDIAALLATHFVARFRTQEFLIYDTRRDKGIYYDKKEVNEITLTDKQFDAMTGDIPREIKAENEDEYRNLWKLYYDAINIKERKNTRMMLRCLPRRYWKYLPEKQ